MRTDLSRVALARTALARAVFAGAALAALAVALALPGAAFAQGVLMPTEPGLGPLGIGHQRVKVEIRDGTAVTRIDQTFVNHTGRQLEATYLFPLPKGAALQDFHLWMAGKKTKGEVLEKDQARAIYEGIVRRMQDPGLLEYVDHDLFRARVFPVPAQGEMRIEISFSQVLDYAEGVYTYRCPFGAGKLGGGRALTTLKDFTFTANVTSKVPIKSVYSPSHRMEVRRDDDHSAALGFEKNQSDLHRDLVLYYTVSKKDVGMNLLSFRDGDDAGYFLLMAAPKTDWQKQEVLGKVVTFVFDTSGSMTRDKLDSAKQALRYALARLHPSDRFNIVRFSTDVERFQEAPVAATKANLAEAEDFVSDFVALGGTAINEALIAGLRDGAHRGDAPHLVVFLTDGEPTVGEVDEGRIAAAAKKHNTHGSRVFVFGVGKDLKATLLDRIAADSGAAVEYARDGKETETKLAGFYNRIAFPILSDVALELGGARAFDVYPRTFPALFKGEQVILVGRYRKPGKHEVTLKGRTGAEARAFAESISFPEREPEHAFIARLWAVRKVGYLLEEIRLHGERPELKDEVVTLGKKFGIVTPYTSYLVVEDAPVAQNRPRPTPRPGPTGGPRRLMDTDEGLVGSAGPAAAEPPPPAPMTAARRERSAEQKKAMDSFATRSGKGGVAASEALKDLKEEEQAPDDVSGVRSAGARTFVWQDGAWTDTAWREGLKVLKVKYLSNAWFALTRAMPDLKTALALGESVRVVLPDGRGVVVGTEGVTKAEEAARFVK